jgi:esterase/lipase
MNTKEYKVQVGQETLACSLDYIDISKRQNVIFLHGAGPSNKEQVKYLAEIFIVNNCNVVRFDFSGHGESTGLLKESSLVKRQQEVLTIINYFKLDLNNLTVIGTSMGGYIATSLSAFFNIKKLILFCPAAYDTKAWNVPFDEEFTKILRRDISLLRSNISELLANFNGRSLLILAENDEIIQPCIVEMYDTAFIDKKEHYKYIIPNSPHPIHRWLADKENEKEQVKKEIKKFMNFA